MFKRSGQTMCSPDSWCVPAKSVASSEGTEAALVLPLVALMALQVSVLYHLHLPNHVFQASATADVQYNSRLSPTGACRVRETRLRVLLPEFQSGRPEPVRPFRNRAHHESVRGKATDQSSVLVSVISSTTSRHTRILRRALSAPKGRMARGRTRESLRGKGGGLAKPNTAESHHCVASLVVSHPDARSSPRSQNRSVFVHTCPRRMSPTVSNTRQARAEDHVPAEVPEAVRAATKLHPQDEGYLGGVDRSQPVPQPLRPPQRGEVERLRARVGMRKSTLPANSTRKCTTLDPPDALDFPALATVASSTYTSPFGVRIERRIR